MNSKNFRLIFIPVILLLALTVATLVGCNKSGGGEISEIFVSNNDMPRLIYVQGQELDLTGGKLTVVINGQPSSVPMTHEDVTVTGFDPSALGNQTLTLTYKGFTTTFAVSVVRRALAENFETDYFVGDKLDLSKGKLKITRDNGTAFSVNLNDPTVSLKSFSSASAGEATVVVEYKDSDLSCECSFNVTVHEVAEVNIKLPSKTKYPSHVTELDLSGGYFTVKAASPSTFSKYVNITNDMIEGYDPTVVTYENRDTTVTQDIKINYLGSTFDFSVEIFYSPVYLVEETSKSCADLDWSGDRSPEFEPELGEAALDAIVQYLTLSSSDKALVQKNTLLSVVRPATVYLTTVYRRSSETFSDAFLISSSGQLTIVGESYESIENAIVKLSDPQDKFNYYASLLMDFSESFGDETLIEGIKISDTILTHTPESIGLIIPMLEHMLAIYDSLEIIPDDWTVESLKAYDLQITVAASKIAISDFVGVGYSSLYTALSSWRANDDFFEIIYSHYLYNRDNGVDQIKNELWGYVPAPALLGEWYVSYIKAIVEEQNMVTNASTSAYLYDTASFMYYYNRALELEKAIAESEDQLCKDLYALMDCKKSLSENLTYGPYGYAFHMGEALNSPAVKSVWAQFIALLHATREDHNATPDMYAEEIEALFGSISSLSPAELRAFISTVNFQYDASEGNVLVLDCSQYVFSTLTNILSSYYSGFLTEETFTLYNNLMVAMEVFSQRAVVSTATGEFKAIMELIATSYGKLSDEDKAVFDQHFGSAYAGYLALYNAVSQETITVPDAFAGRFEELDDTLDAFDRVFAYIAGSSSVEDQSRATPLLFALGEKAMAIHAEIIASGNADAIAALYAKSFSQSGSEYTLDNRVYGAAGISLNLMTSTDLSTSGGAAEKVWDIYSSAQIGDFLAMAADLLLAEFDGKLYEGNDIAEIMAAFASLSAEARMGGYKLALNQLYYNALNKYFVDKLGSAALIDALIQSEIYYTLYENDGAASSLNTFKTEFAKAKAAVEKLGDLEVFNTYLAEFYNHYLEIYTALN